MKKVLSLILATLMLLCMIPSMALTAQAVDVLGDWTTYRAAAEYPENSDKPQKPEAGYKYTEEGFVVVPADYTDSTPFMTVQTKEKQSVKEGLYLEFRVDDYCYNGPEHNIDSWICISITNKAKVTPGAPAYGGGWMCLIRGNGGGANAKAESCNTIDNSSFSILGSSQIKPGLDGEGREIYTLEATYSGNQYTFKLNGVALPGMSQISANLNNMDPSGEFYVGVTLYSSMKDGQAAMSILKYGTDKNNAYVPTGTDSKEPEPNLIKIADISDPSTVPENQPALYFDASTNDAPNGTNLVMNPLGDNSFRVTMSDSMGFFSWNMSRSVSYSGTDFPIFTALLRNYCGDGGGMWYYGGDVLGAEGDNRTDWSSYEGAYYEDEENEYILVTVDLSDRWEGRINGIRFDFAVPSEGWEFDVCYMGFFRSIDEAEAFAETRLGEWGVKIGEETEDTEAPEETVAATDAPATETPVTEAETTPVESTTTPVTEIPEPQEGCGSFVGTTVVGLLVLALGACAVIRKKED